MESNADRVTPDEAGSALAAADDARRRLAAGLRLPAWLPAALAVVVAVQIGTAAYGIAAQTVAGLVVALGGAGLFLGTALLALRDFRGSNGVRVDGLASQLVLGSGSLSTSSYLGAFALATWAAFDSRWGYVVLAAAVGGAMYTLAVLRWWRAYRADPAARTVGASPLVLVLIALVACLGLVALVVGG
jgi:hypothetical protein